MPLKSNTAEANSVQCCDPYNRDCKNTVSQDSGHDQWSLCVFWSALEKLGWQSYGSNTWMCLECHQSRLPLKVENMVVLKYTSNVCYVELVEATTPLPNLEINLEKGTWTSKGNRTLFVGSSKIVNGPVIGVFDRTNFQHLETMVSKTCAATRSPGSWDD